MISTLPIIENWLRFVKMAQDLSSLNPFFIVLQVFWLTGVNQGGIIGRINDPIGGIINGFGLGVGFLLRGYFPCGRSGWTILLGINCSLAFGFGGGLGGFKLP
jgi:hypothetical protein